MFDLKSSVGLSYTLDCAVIGEQTWLYAGTGDVEGYLEAKPNNFFAAANLTAGATKQNDLEVISPEDTEEESSNPMGWCIEFANGERMTTPPLVYNGYVAFATFTPDEDVCSTSGTANVYLLDGDSASGGWGGGTKMVTLDGVRVDGLSLADGKISLGVSLLTKDGRGNMEDEGFDLLGDNLAVMEIPEEVKMGSESGLGSKKMMPFYWKSR